MAGCSRRTIFNIEGDTSDNRILHLITLLSNLTAVTNEISEKSDLGFKKNKDFT